MSDFETCYKEQRKIVREAPYTLITTGETRFFVTTYHFVPPNLVIDHIQDITEQKAMEEELNKLRLKLVGDTDKVATLEEQLQQEETKRQALEQQLAAVQEQLEAGKNLSPRRERGRTGQLKAANLQLEKEIQEHQQAEESLKETRTRLRAQYKGIPIPTYSWRKVGEDFILIDYNYAAEKNSNGRIINFMSKPARDIFKDRPQVLGDFERCYRERREVTREAPYRLVTTGEMRHYFTTYNYFPPQPHCRLHSRCYRSEKC